MGFTSNVAKRVQSSTAATMPSLGAASDSKSKTMKPKLSFFGRRIRLQGNSNISIPLGVVLLFPLLVIVTILFLVLQHSANPGSMLIPAGAPPSIR